MEIPFYRQESGVIEHDHIADVLDGDNGDYVQKLEEEFESYIGVEYAIATSSGTGALHLAMLALDLKRGDKVLCSVNAFPSVPEVVRHFDAEPTFIDIDPVTYNIDLDKLEKYLDENASRKLKAVIVSHIAGQCIDLKRLYAMAKKYDVKVVEDAADALGATYNGDKIGSTGADITCFSFSLHLKNSICNGGMIVTNDEEISERAKLLRNHAMVVNEDGLSYIYDIVAIGNKYTMSQLDAAYILAQLEKQDEFIQKQRAIAKKYSDALADTPHISVPSIENEDQSFSLYIIEIDKNRDSFAKELEEKGIKTALHYIPLHLLSYYKAKYMLRVNDFPIALRTFQKVLSIPMFPSMTDAEIKYVIDTIKSIAKTRV